MLSLQQPLVVSTKTASIQQQGLNVTGENKVQFYIPRGFAHGFAVLSETAIFAYKCDNFYNKTSEGGILWNDPDLAIDWKLPLDKIILSEKDKIQKTFKEKDF